MYIIKILVVSSVVLSFVVFQIVFFFRKATTVILAGVFLLVKPQGFFVTPQKDDQKMGMVFSAFNYCLILHIQILLTKINQYQ